MKKTNAARILDSNNITYELVSYTVDENDLSATHVAEVIGVAADCIFKTLVIRAEDKSLLVAVVPGDAEVDLKKVAKASGHKACAMIAVKELLPLTGYIRGGCSPLGMKKNFLTLIDEQALQQQAIYISAGQRGLQIKLNPHDLVNVCQAIVAALTRSA